MPQRTLFIALGLSVVLNVFVVGAFVGVLLSRQFSPQPAVAAGRPNPLMSAADRLDPTDREVFRALMQDEVQREGPTQLDARQARRQASALLRAPTFDRAAAGQALDRARADDAEVRKAIENAILDFAAKLDVNGRSTLADGLGHGPGWLARRGPGPVAPPPPH